MRMPLRPRRSTRATCNQTTVRDRYTHEKEHNLARDLENVAGDQVEGHSSEELAQEDGEQLPEREQMSLSNAKLAAPVNAAVAANVLSDNSIAYADATQTAPITQTN